MLCIEKVPRSGIVVHLFSFTTALDSIMTSRPPSIPAKVDKVDKGRLRSEITRTPIIRSLLCPVRTIRRCVETQSIAHRGTLETLLSPDSMRRLSN